MEQIPELSTYSGRIELPLVIGGLPYILQGNIPERLHHFQLTLKIPEETNTNIESGLLREPQFGLKMGQVGSIRVEKTISSDRYSYHGQIVRVVTDTKYCPVDARYYKGNGLGSFLLDAVCALADKRSWRVSLSAASSDTDRISDAELIAWYKRRGFRQGMANQPYKSVRGGILRLPSQICPLGEVGQRIRR